MRHANSSPGTRICSLGVMAGLVPAIHAVPRIRSPGTPATFGKTLNFLTFSAGGGRHRRGFLGITAWIAGTSPAMTPRELAWFTSSACYPLDQGNRLPCSLPDAVHESARGGT
jgi:hypothetical protein